MKYAIIENIVVANIVELNPKNAADFPSAVISEEYPVNVGDTYENDKFYRDGEELLSNAELRALEEEARKNAPEPLPYVTVEEELETYKTALNTLGVQTEEVTDDAE